jgi:hypothetical protein
VDIPVHTERKHTLHIRCRKADGYSSEVVMLKSHGRKGIIFTLKHFTEKKKRCCD